MEAYVLTLEQVKEGTLVKSLKDQILQKEYDLAYFCTANSELVSANLNQDEGISSKNIVIQHTQTQLTKMVKRNDILSEEKKQLMICKTQQKRKISFLTERIEKLEEDRNIKNWSRQ